MKRRILLVDDDLQGLNSLQRLLQPMEPEWHMVFAASGEEAVGLVQQEGYDVVASAMNMAGMHGGRVLEHVQEFRPDALRIALAGPVDRELLAQYLSFVHQALSWPCDLDQVLTLVANAGKLWHPGVDPQMRQVLGKLEPLLSMPGLYKELCELLESEGATVRQVADVIRQDIGMTVKILQLVNSAFFGLRRTVEDIQDAVAFLGTETIKALVLVHGVFDQIGELGTQKLSITELWVHSLNVAKGARALAAMEGLSRQMCAEAFMGGMLHDVGVLVLAKEFPERYDRVADHTIANRIPLIHAEHQEFGLAHPEVGAYLLGLWGIQPAVLQAVSLHHCPSRVQATSLSPLLAIHLADIFCGASGRLLLFENARLDEAAIDGLRLRERMAGWRHVLSQSVW